MERGSFVLGHQLTSDQLDARILNYPTITVPERKHMLNTTPVGIDRAILFDDGAYNNRDIQLIIGFEGKQSNSNIQKFLSVLDTGKYIDFQMYSDPDYTYQVIRQSTGIIARPTYSDSYRELTITLSSAPYRYVAPVKAATITTATSTLVNPTNYVAKPYIKIVGDGGITLTVNGVDYKFTNVTGSIELDSAMQNVWRVNGNVLVNENAKMAVGPFPTLKPGSNTIKLSTGTATIEPRWRTL
ncbi:hypothetical protein [Weissella cibaria]|uniref:hypothetical protein n=1 Tax=Weissella cibaria TaxID=137591 RepID=UPI002A75BDB4|nr:hypothetical protein [Weissella cibaria]MDY2520342.1 hypothetical protein [Weissella cibaria]